jgi:uncharacterized protein (DUF433 family)
VPFDHPEAIKSAPAYSIAEAARFLNVKPQTVREWFRGANPVLNNSKGLISFMDIIQAHVLHTIRRGYHIPMKQVRKASDTLKRIGGSLDYLAHKDFYHDKVHLFLQLDEGLISLSEGGQFVDKEIITEGLRQLMYGYDGFTEIFFPKANGVVQTDFGINPKVNYGKLYLSRIGVGAEAIRDRFFAGEKIVDICADYRATQTEVEEAIRWHDRLAA